MNLSKQYSIAELKDLVRSIPNYNNNDLKVYIAELLTLILGNSGNDNWKNGVGIVFNDTENIGIGTSTPSHNLETIGTFQLSRLDNNSIILELINDVISTMNSSNKDGIALQATSNSNSSGSIYIVDNNIPTQDAIFVGMEQSYDNGAVIQKREVIMNDADLHFSTTQVGFYQNVISMTGYQQNHNINNLFLGTSSQHYFSDTADIVNLFNPAGDQSTVVANIGSWGATCAISTGEFGSHYISVSSSYSEVGMNYSDTYMSLVSDNGTGNVGHLLTNMPVYANEVTASLAGLISNILYRTPTGEVRIKL